MAEKTACDHKIDINFLVDSAEEIKLVSNTIDTILVTYTLCSIPNLNEALNEIKRVMKPEAKILFCEHGIAPDLKVRKWQNRINPLWSKMFGGCNINRDIPLILSDSGFKVNNLQQMYLPSTPKIVGYNYWGVASI
jgi:ubiquinone/menaquinone biosynthesis C-methylase UbiE